MYNVTSNIITGYIHCAGCGLLIERSRGIDCHPQCEAARPTGQTALPKDDGTGRATADLGMKSLDEFWLVNKLEVMCTALENILREAESWHSIHGHGLGSTKCDAICKLIPEMKRAIAIGKYEDWSGVPVGCGPGE